MSKFLKFIVHLVIFCTIICVLALTIPRFCGIYTAINDGTYEDTNLPVGSVTYAREASLDSLNRGDSILVQNQGNVYRYYVQDIDVEGKTCTVVNSASTSGEELRVAVPDSVPKVVVTIGVIGYLAAATQSIEGLVILGLAVLFLIILYVIAEVWKKSSREEYEDSEDDGPELKSRKELKREEKERARQLKEEERAIKAQEKENKKNKKRRKKKKTGGFVDDIYEDELEMEPESEPEVETMSAITPTGEAHEELRKEVSAAIGEEPAETSKEQEAEAVEEPQAEEKPAIESTKEIVLEEEPAAQEEPAAVEEEPQEEPARKLAIPLWNANQLAAKAKEAGDAPAVFEDEIAQVTFFDYSEILSGNGGKKEEK